MASAAALQLNQLHFGHFEVIEVIGNGAYGVVYKAKFLGIDCAVKIVHTAPVSHLVDETSLKRFEQECQILHTLKHPNIVQSFGTITLNYPVLVMELMDCNLNRYLENNKNLSFQMEVSIADDVVNGIRFLHQHKVVHRDISGANILMTGCRAKISDLGMAKLLSAFQPNQLTPCPGNKVYMPFSDILDNPSYNEKIDIYSYGVVVLQILTKKYPNPTNHIKEEHGCKVFPKELERHQNAIMEIHDNHPMKRIALSCLNDDQDKRLSAIDIQKLLEAIKNSEVYIASALKNEQSIQIVQQCDILQLYREHQILLATNASQEGQIQQLQEEVRHLKLEQMQVEQKVSDHLRQERVLMECKLEEDRKTICEGFRKELEGVVQQVEQKAMAKIQENESKCILAIKQAQENVVTAQEKEAQASKAAEESCLLVQQIEENYRIQIYQLERRSNSFSSSISTSLSETQLSISRNSTGGVLLFDTDNHPASTKLHRDSIAVVHNKTIYVRPARTKYIIKYYNGQWSPHLECKVDNCSLAVVLNTLVTIGGRSTDKNSEVDVVGTLYRCADTNEWVDDLQPMPTARELALTITTGKTLIVAGGRDKRKSVLVVVEVFHEDTQQWQTACCLPFPLYFASITTFDESLIIHGMKQRSPKEPIVSLNCKLTDLICSCAGSNQAMKIWDCQVLQIPPKSSLVKFNHHLLAVGGQLQDGQATGTVFSYSLDVEEWIEITSLNVPRYLCFTAVMSECLYIIGGDQGSNELTDSVEVGIYQ